MKRLLTFLTVLCCCLLAAAEEKLPTASPTMTYTAEDGTETSDTQYDGSAPLAATFRACPENVGSWTPLYEWRFTKSGASEPFLVRYDEDTEYTFSESGSFTVELLVSFVQGTDTIAYEMDEPFELTISESKLEVPNAFTPNGDGVNDTYRVKDGYQSIISFKAMIFDRWGKKLYEWNDPAGSWDGKVNGSYVNDGVYYLNLQARGADGKKYNIKKAITLLRTYDETGTSTTE